MASVDTPSGQLESLFQKGGVLSDSKNFIKSPPAQQMNITFGADAVKPGEQLKVSSASTHPSTPKWEGLDDEALYTLMMVDIDAPPKGKDKNKNYLHWLTVNMPGDDIARSNLVQKYTPPNPPKGTGSHRYVLLAFRQGGKIDHKELQKHLKDGPATFQLPMLLSVAAHAGSSKYPTLEAGTYFTAEAGDVGMAAVAAVKKSAGISIVTGDGKSSLLSPSSKPVTPKSGVSPMHKPATPTSSKQGTPRAAAAGASKDASPASKSGKTLNSKMRHLSV